MPRRIAYSNALTEREWMVARAVGRGLDDKEIGVELGIAYSTVRSHIECIFAKLGLRDRKALMRWVWEQETRPDAPPGGTNVSPV